MGILVSVIIPTYNRPDKLKRVVESLTAQTIAPSLFEIIVVDNGTTEAAQTIMGELAASYSQHSIITIRESRLGASVARNTGVRHARGDYLAFIDDDAKADERWLETALDCFAHVHPKPQVVGGRILPLYESAKPDWFKDEYEIRTKGEDAHFLTQGDCFSGSNMIFCKYVFKQTGGFGEEIGPKGESLALGEETMLFLRMWQSANSPVLYYSPRIVVFHSVPVGKMRVGYRLRRVMLDGNVRGLNHDQMSARTRCGVMITSALKMLRHTWWALKAWPRYRVFQQWAVEMLALPAVEAGWLMGLAGLKVRMNQASY